MLLKRISHDFVALPLLVAFILCCVGPARAQGRSTATLDSVLKNLDDHAASFKSLSADVQRTKVTVVVNDKSTDTGTSSCTATKCSWK